SACTESPPRSLDVALPIYLQFLVVAVGFLGKEFVRWHREGKKVHIFNPSAFTLGLFSLLILATGTTNLTWARELATTLTLAPNRSEEHTSELQSRESLVCR